MVFESLVAELLNRLLNKFVENVNKTQLNIGIWGGDVVLEKLILKEGALDELDLPIKTIYGHLGKLMLKIPWKNLYSAPVIISIESLFLLAVPNRDVIYDPTKEENLKQEQKQDELKKIEEAKKEEREKDTPPIDDTFLEKLVTQIIKNVQIKINDIHIRYEDRHTHVGRPFAIGVTLHHFYVYTTDANWKETVIQESVTKVNKIVDIDSLAVYWNCNSRLFKSRRVVHENANMIERDFQDTICTTYYLPQGFYYVLGPINASMKLFMNSKPELDHFQVPKYQLDIQLSKLAVGINKFQYHDMIRLAEYLNRLTVAAPYRKYRPLLDSYRGHYRRWWQFAYTCILEEFIRPSRNLWRWDHIASHRERCRQYASAFRSKLIAKKPSEELESELKQLERDIDVFNIVLIRQRVEMEIETMSMLNSGEDDEEGWLAWLRSARLVRWFMNNSDDDLTTSGAVQMRIENAMTPKEKATLYKAIGYTEHSGPVRYPTSFVRVEISFNLDSFEVKIRENLNLMSLVLFLKLSTVKIDLDERPAIHGIKVNMSILRLTVYGLQQGMFSPVLVMSKELADKSHLLDLLFEMNPLDQECDQRLHLNFRTLQIVYDSRTLKKINEIFRAPHLRSFNRLHDHLENVKHMSASGLRYAIEKRSALEIKVDILSSYIIIPHSGVYKRNEDILVLNIGHLKVDSSPRNTGNLNAMLDKGIPAEMVMQTMISHSYDKFILHLEATQVLIALKGENWHEILLENKVTPLHILEPMALIVIYNKCLITDDPTLPIFKLTISVPNVGVSISDLRLRKLIVLLLSIPKQDHEETKRFTIVEENDYLSSPVLSDDWNPVRGRRNTRQGSRGMPLDEEEEPVVKKVQAIKMDLTCRVENVLVQCLLTKNFTKGTKFLTLHLIKIELEMVQQTFDIDVIARIGGIFADIFQTDEAIRFIDTPMANTEHDKLSEYLFTINLILVDETSPELHTKHGGTLQYLQIQFTTLNVLLYQEVITHVIQIVQTFVLEFKTDLKFLKSKPTRKTNSKLNFADIQRRLVDRMKDKSTAIVESRLNQLHTIAQDTAFRLQVDLRKVKVAIANSATPIGDIAIEGCSVKATRLRDYNKFIIHLEKVEVLDCHRKSIHPRILSVVGDETLSMELISYKTEKLLTHEHDRYPDILLNAKIACVRIVYLNRFFSLLFIFINKVKLVNILFEDGTFGEAPNPNVKKNVKEIVDAKYTKINIDLDAPILIIPLNSRSLDSVTLDFGFLTIINERQALRVINGDGIPAFVEYIKIKLEDIKIDRVKLTRKYEIVNATSLLLPANFFIAIERNLSMSWHTSIPACTISMRLKELTFNITEEDYKMIMTIFYQNFSESYEIFLGDEEGDDRFESIAIPNTRYDLQFDAEGYLVDEPNSNAQESQTITFKLDFLADSISITFYTGGAVTLDDNPHKYAKASLARFTLETLCFQGTGLLYGKTMMTFRMVNCFLDDMREERADREIRLLQRKDGTLLIGQDNFQEDLEFPSCTMLDIFYTQKGNDTFMDVCVHRFRLILSLEYMVKLKEFFLSPLQKEVNKLEEDKPRSSRRVSAFSLASTQQPRVNISDQQPSNKLVNLKVENPDIVIVESIDNPEGDALTISGEILAKLHTTAGKQGLNATITELQLNSCCFNAAKDKPQKGIILRPCTISVLGSTSKTGDLSLDVCVTEIKVNLSSTTIDLFRRMYTVMQGDSNKPVSTSDDHTDQSDIWKPQQLSEENFWFFQGERLPSIDLNVRRPNSIRRVGLFDQICVVSVPSFIVFVEAGEGKWRQPMIFVNMKLECIVYDWSYNLFLSNNMCLQIDYYNSSLASWEPLIEPIEKTVNRKQSKQLWELKVDVQMCSYDEEAFDVSEKPAELSITISSQDKLEVTLTKTSIGILSKLGELFTETRLSSVVGSALAPFVVKNMSGLDITVVLSTGAFQLSVLESHSKQYDVMLTSGSQIGLSLKEESLTTAIDERDEGSPKSTMERYLSIKVTLNTEYCSLSVPVFRTDMRYFSLKHCGEYGDRWGLLWDSSLWEGSTVLTLRGVVKVYNDLKQQIHIYYSISEGEPLVHVGTVQPNDELNLPIQSIYTATGALIFSAKGYKVTNESFTWKDLNKVSTVHKLLKCTNLQHGDTFFINVVGFRKQLFFENTSRYNLDSAMYNIFLRPAVKIKNFLPVDTVISFLDSGLKYETLIKAGEQIQMVNVEPGVSKLFIKVPDYLNKEWSSESDVQWDTPTFHTVRLISDEDGYQKTLEIRIFTKESNGQICKQLACQFWMLNKTGLNLAYRQSDEHDNTCYQGNTTSEIVLFSFWGSVNGKKSVSIMVSNDEWSNRFSLDAAGSTGVVNCKVNSITYSIGVRIDLTKSKLTKQVTFTPYYVLVNNLNICIECQEADFPDSPWIAVNPNDCTPFWPNSSTKNKELCLRIENSPQQSIPFSYCSVHTTLLSMDNKYGAVFVDVHKMEGAVYVTFWPYKPGLAPTLLINHTHHPIQFWEENETETTTLCPKEILLFTWRKPTGSRTVTYRIWKKGELTDNLQRDGIEEISYKTGEKVYWVSFLDGTQRTTLFTEDARVVLITQSLSELKPPLTEFTLSINSIGISFVNNTTMKELLYITFANNDAVWEARKKIKKRFKPLSQEKSQLIEKAYQKFVADIRVGRETSTVVKLDRHLEVNFETKEIVRPSKRYLQRVSHDGVWFRLRLLQHQVTMHGKIARLQIDNQKLESVFPVVLAPVPPPKTVDKNQKKKPFAELSIIRRYMDNSPVKHYKYFMILIQEFQVNVEMDFVNAFSEFFDWENVPENVEVLQFTEDVHIAREPLKTNVYSISSQEEKHFYDILHFSPLKIHLSFSLSSSKSTTNEEYTLPFVMFILYGLGVTLTDFHDVVLKLGCFERKYTFLSQHQKYNEVISHYSSQFLKQTYVLVLGLDLIGNPWGLLMGIRQGVTDLFYEPYQGIIQGPEDFGEGMLLGIRSMFGHTVGGTFGAVSNISGAIGTGIAVLTFDQDFQRRRLESINQVPEGIQSQLVRSGKGLFMGVIHGVSGVVANPISGAKQEGVTGFFKGVGRGLAGLVVRPTVGMFDFVSGSLGVATKGANVTKNVRRVRLPRYLGRDGLVRPYNQAESEGNMLLQVLEEGRYAHTDTYEYHVPGINRANNALLLTSNRIMYVQYIKHRDYYLAWEYPWEMLEPPAINKNGILIIPKNNHKKGFLASPSSQETGKQIPINSNKERRYLMKKIQELQSECRSSH